MTLLRSSLVFVLCLLAHSSTTVSVELDVSAAGETSSVSTQHGLQETPGHAWLMQENARRVGVYLKMAKSLISDSAKLCRADEDPFMPAWEAINQMVAAMELLPEDPNVFAFAGRQSIRILVEACTGEGAVEPEDALGFFARAVTLKPSKLPSILKWLMKYTRKHQKRTDPHVVHDLHNMYRVMKSKWKAADGTVQAEIPRSSSPGRSVAANAAAAALGMDATLTRGKVLGGHGVDPQGPETSFATRMGGHHDMRDEAVAAGASADDLVAIKSSPLVDDEMTAALDAATDADGSVFRPFDLFPTRLAVVNLPKLLGMDAAEAEALNKKITDLAHRKFSDFKDEMEAQRGPMAPNDLDDAFFGAQFTDAVAISKGAVPRGAIDFWPELYEDCPEIKAVIKGIRAACVEYMKRFARPGTAIEWGPNNPHGESFWAAAYLNGTLHSHHVHQASIVSATYYSSVGGSGGSPIVFSDPRSAAPMDNYELHNGEHVWQPRGPFHQQFNFFPKPGDLVLFPSWLVHKVPSHRGTGTRVAWPFNYNGGLDAWSRTAQQ